MNKKLQLPFFSNGKLESFRDTTVFLEDLHFCPHCQKDISPKFEFGSFHYTSKSGEMNEVLQNGHVDCVFECPSCHESISVRYEIKYTITTHSFLHWDSFNIDKVSPYPTLKFPFDKSISTVSPRFEKIYTQTIQAKAEGKDELVGIGYRKSIEFLLKDYLISNNSDELDSISKMHLADCINKLENQKVKDLAKASIWLGNDETHYVRKHSDLGISELEKFLNTLVSYLTFEITASDASEFINQQKTSKNPI
ncbi:MAG: hypothetical protein U0M88_02225 [Faecalicoccus sp.]|uniref:hypothetical protein n=1 Tax=Faecalicoccus sp. TaxID=1971758 RepID=UPI002F928784